MKVRKKEVLVLIDKEEGEKRILEKNIKCLQEKLCVVNENLQQHRSLCENYDRTIKETENGFQKVIDIAVACYELSNYVFL